MMPRRQAPLFRQATRWPGATGRSTGIVRAQASSPTGQRPWNRHACGSGSTGLRTSPLLLVEGEVQRQGEVINVVLKSVVPLG